MQYNNISKELLEYRSQIDEIDSKIIDLLNNRMQIVQKVGKHKEENNDRFFIRSNREADMIKNLVGRAGDIIPKSVVVFIWRKIITVANMLEQDVKIALHNPQKSRDYYGIIKDYYGDFMPISNYSSSNKVILGIEKDDYKLGAFSISDNLGNPDHWWINMANSKNGLKVFAKIPFIEYSENKSEPKDELFMVAIKEEEQSCDDRTLIVVESGDEISKQKLLGEIKKFDLQVNILSEAVLEGVRGAKFYLVEIDGFFKQDDEKIKEISSSSIKPYIKVIGHYPKPIII